MRTKVLTSLRMALSLSAACVFAPLAHAVELGDSAELHGYGSQDYWQTSHNTYMDASHTGTWDNNFLGLVGTVSLNDASKLWAQLETSTEDTTRFTWFFVDYQLTNELRVHAGRVKFPLGLYNETIDAKFIQMSSLEPALYQEAADLVHDSYHGVGLDYQQSLGSNGSLLWQVYGGNTYDTDPPPDSRDRRMGGGRVTYETPIQGLRFMASAYYTRVQVLATGQMVGETKWIGSADFVNGDWDLKSEYGSHSFRGMRSYAYYAQVGRNFLGKWTAFARYDYYVADKSLSHDDSYHQRIGVLGVNYKIKGNISLRLENHFNSGYGLPVASGEMLPGSGQKNWNLTIVGVHFIF